VTEPDIIRRVPAARGWHWIVAGWHLFLKKPLTWIVFTITTWAIVKVSGVHPALMLAVGVMLPVIMGGWALACRAADRGESIPVTMLFDGFRDRARDLATIGGVNLMGIVLQILLLLAMGGDLLIQSQTNPASITPDQAADLESRMFVAFMIMVAVALPLGLAIWFAPLAIVLDGMKASRALRTSLAAVLRNTPAFMVYGVVIGIIASALFMAAAAAGATIPAATEFAFWMLMPLLMTTVYASYLDIFGEQTLTGA
jgi:hypothetical protein